jgi:hypothetical protein
MATSAKAAGGNNYALSTEAVMDSLAKAASAKSAKGNALSTEAVMDSFAVAPPAKPAGGNNNALATEPEKEMPRKVMGPVEAKIAAARSNTVALYDLADFADARIDSAEF